jgi:hypothetical protein
MIPYLLIAAAAFIGLVGWGLPGFLIGLAGGYVLSFLIGILGNLVHGGLVPRKIRSDIAINFVTTNGALVDSAFPEMARVDQIKAVETAIEHIFRTSEERNASMDLTADKSLRAIREATLYIVESEPKPEIKEFYLALEHCIEHYSYPTM